MEQLERRKTMKIDVITVFPQMVETVFSWGVIGQALKKDLLKIHAVDLRDFATDRHQTVDGRPFGGGPGMVMRVDTIDAALKKVTSHKSQVTSRIVLLSPQGQVFSQPKAEELSQLDHLILISGRYEGVDERVRQHLVDEELSIGEYVLSGGEIPAMVIIDAVARLLPGVVGDPESLEHESFSGIRSKQEKISLLDFPQYTRPVEYKRWKVPEILRSGDHQKINQWRQKQARLKTLKRSKKS
jgi:tRNA (guanine37-N1)-methyltransferase